MNSRKLRPFIASLLALALLVSLTTPAFARKTDWFTRFPQEVDFSSLKPDSAPFEAKAAELETAIQTDNAAQVQTLLEELLPLYEQFETEYTVFEKAYSRDLAAYSGDYLLWSDAILALDAHFTRLLCDLTGSPYRAVAAAVLGEDAVDYLSAQSPDIPEELALLSRHAQLVDTYWSLIAKKHTILYNGVEYDEETLNAETPMEWTRIPIWACSWSLPSSPTRMRSEVFRPIGRPARHPDGPLPRPAGQPGSCAALFQNTDQAALVAMVRPHMDSISSEYAALSY